MENYYKKTDVTDLTQTVNKLSHMNKNALWGNDTDITILRYLFSTHSLKSESFFLLS
jgi:hypothetical protein